MRMAAVTPTWSNTDHVSGLRQASCSKKMSAFAAIRVQRLGNDADVADARLLHGVHHSRKGAERDVLVSSQKNGLALGIAHLLPQFSSNLVDINWIISQENAL